MRSLIPGTGRRILTAMTTTTTFALALGIAFGSSVVGAQQADAQRQLSLSNCADESGFSTCQKRANEKLTSCLDKAKKNGNQKVDLVACDCSYYTEHINCAATSCWNRVNECNYQIFVTGFLANCPTAKNPIPYFPIADSNAADACSCNLGKIFNSIAKAIKVGATCSNQQNGPDAGANVQAIQGCNCCQVSTALSSIVAICPKTNPQLIGLDSATTLQTTLNTPFNSCGKYLAQYDCVSTLGFPKVEGGVFYNPSNFPGTSGSDPLTNGGGTVNEPQSGSVFSWTNAADKHVYTIKAAGVDSGMATVKPTGTSSGTDATVAVANPAPTATGATTSGNKTGASANSRFLNRGLVAMVLLVWVW